MENQTGSLGFRVYRVRGAIHTNVHTVRLGAVHRHKRAVNQSLVQVEHENNPAGGSISMERRVRGRGESHREGLPCGGSNGQHDESMGGGKVNWASGEGRGEVGAERGEGGVAPKLEVCGRCRGRSVSVCMCCVMRMLEHTERRPLPLRHQTGEPGRGLRRVQ